MRRTLLSILVFVTACSDPGISTDSSNVVPPGPANTFDRFQLGPHTPISRGGESNSNNTLYAYTAYPSTCQTENGDILAMYFRGPGHDTAQGYVALNRSSDLGETWGNVTLDEMVLHRADGQYPDRMNVIPGGLVMLKGSLHHGRIVATLEDRFISVSHVPDRIPYVMVSDDNGHTWSSTIALPQPAAQRNSVGGRAVELDDGSLLVPLNELERNTNYSSLGIAKSFDGGLSWSNVSVLHVDQVAFTEPVCGITRCGPHAGEVLCLLRTSDYRTSIRPSCCYTSRTYSADGGMTWSTPEYVHEGYSRPHWAETDRCVLANPVRHLTYTNNTPDSNLGTAYGYLHVSLDGGMTWTNQGPVGDMTFEPHGGGYVYGDVVLLASNSFGIVQSLADELNPYTFVRTEFVRVFDTLETPEQALGSALWAHYDINSAISDLPNATWGRGTALPRWRDQSGQGHDMIPVIDTTGNPIPFHLRWGDRVAGGFLGQAVLDSEDIAAMRLETAMPLQQPYAVTIAVHAWSPNQTLVLFDDGSGYPNGNIVVNDSLGMWLWAGSGSSVMRFNTRALNWPAGVAIVTVIFDGPRSSVRINGVAAAHTSGQVASRSMSSFRFGGAGHATLASSVREIVISSSADLSTIGTVESLMSERHRIR